MWSVYYDERLEAWLNTIPSDMKARVLRIIDMLLEFGPSNVREPYVKHLRGYKKLYEIRAKGKDGMNPRGRTFLFYRIWDDFR